jgi:hypothetical protein
MLSLLQVIFLIGNKSDLEAQRDVTYEEAKQFADENGELCFADFFLHVFLIVVLQASCSSNVVQKRKFHCLFN